MVKVGVEKDWHWPMVWGDLVMYCAMVVAMGFLSGLDGPGVHHRTWSGQVPTKMWETAHMTTLHILRGWRHI